MISRLADTVSGLGRFDAMQVLGVQRAAGLAQQMPARVSYRI